MNEDELRQLRHRLHILQTKLAQKADSARPYPNYDGPDLSGHWVVTAYEYAAAQIARVLDGKDPI